MASANNSRTIRLGLLAAAVSAILIWFGTGLFPWWPLIWFAPLPVLLFAVRNSWRAAALVAFTAWAAGHLNTNHYFGAVLQVPLIGQLQIVAAPAIIFTLGVVLFRTLLRRAAYWTALIALPAVWVSFEYIFNLTSPHGTAISISYSELNFLPVLQLASITGPWGISFLLLAFSSALAIAIHLRREVPKQASRIAVVACSVTALVLVSGAIRLALPPPPGHDVKVGMAASDIPANRGVAPQGADTQRILHDYAAQAELLAVRGAQIIVLPEHLGEVTDADRANADAIFQPLADNTKTTIVVGLSDVTTQAAYNQARIYTPGTPVLSYNKHHLLPPFESRFAPGTSTTTMPQSNGLWGVEICKDMDFTQLSRQYGNAGAALMLVPAWDFTLDRFSHGHIAVMRAVESGFALVRAARGGYLTVTDNRGRIIAETQSNSAPFATLLASVPAVHDATLYQRFGDWFAWTTFAILLLALIQLIRSRAN